MSLKLENLKFTFSICLFTFLFYFALFCYYFYHCDQIINYMAILFVLFCCYCCSRYCSFVFFSKEKEERKFSTVFTIINIYSFLILIVELFPHVFLIDPQRTRSQKYR